MDEPLKILFRYKNNNRRTQYHTYIYVGDISNNLLKILKKIQDKTFYETFIFLTADEIKSLENYYGDKWYTKFFNTYHINFSIEQIRKNKNQQEELSKKMSQVWFDSHIKKFTLLDKKILYNYETLIKDEILRKEQKRKRTKVKEDEKELDYTTTKKTRINDIEQQNRQILRTGNLNPHLNPNTHSNIHSNTHIQGGFNDIYDYVDEDENYEKQKEFDVEVDPDGEQDLIDFVAVKSQDDDPFFKKNELDKMVDDNKNSAVDFEEGLDIDYRLDEEELDIEDLEKIYQDNDVMPDNNIGQTSNLIQMALKDEKIFKKLEHGMIEFDTSKDNLMFDDSLRNVYYKHFIVNEYIFKDDTIKTIKNKICSTIKNNPKFEKDAFIVPSRQYLWSEYFFNDKIEKIMIGQKWIKRSDILNIDVEPNNNLRVYEELRGNLKFLRDNIRRYGSKIKWEDDDYNILYDYESYYTNNEIYLLDIYNELGQNFNIDQEELRNLTDVYIRVYFRRIKTDDIKYIIEYLNGDTKVESNKTKTIYETLNNDLLIEYEIMKDVEHIKKTANYKYLFKDNYITQSVIHVNLRTLNNTKIDLFRIFNEFIVDHKYPFIQFQTIDGQIIFKYSEADINEFSSNKDNIDVLSKWFENAPYGISFKVRITEKNTEKFMAINLSDTGRIEYKTQWKEEDKATIDDIKKTYEYVKELIEKLNHERNKVTFDIPFNEEFKYAFINTIQKFELPEKYVINHNDLSEFSRYFYPYVALVIEPRKRISKIKKSSEKGKFGTYLRYKRVSKYENQARIEQRVLYFMRNYDYNDQTLSNEISKQFNITIERALEEIDRVKNKYPNIKKSRKILKKLENIPKYKPPGIGIDIQGKQRDRYKIRISGARNKEQLDRIITFYSILIFLYVETYLFKKTERQILKEKLKKLTNIAKRRNRVDDIVNYEKEIKSVKQMAQFDKKRIGFKPEKGQNQWSRSCQNSGNDKKRQPKQYLSIDELLRQGFKLNEQFGIYEKKVQIKGRGGKKKDVIIRAVGLDSMDEEGNSTGMIYYSCNPERNSEHMFVGFLSRSNNPFGQCMPCCFKKDPLISKNKDKRDYYLKCIGKIETVEKITTKTIGDKLYILQDTNKIQEGRIGFLPKYLDYFFNQMLNKIKKIKHHYLLSSHTGYYFKFGSRQEEQPFLNSIAAVLDLSIEDFKKILVDKLEKDKNDLLFTALNNGDIRTIFNTRDKYIEFIKTSNFISFDTINHIISLPGVINQNGFNIITFKKETIIIKKTLEKEKIRDDFIVVCQNNEEINNVKDKNRNNIFLVKENKNYYPIVLVTKKDEITKNFDIQKIFKYEDKKDNIVNHIFDFYDRNCQTMILDKSIGQTNAKIMYKILLNINDKDFIPQYQAIDARNKTKYLITNDSLIIPVKPSGSIYNLPIIKSIDNKLLSLLETIKKFKKLYEISKQKDIDIKIKPIGVYYDHKIADKITIIGVMIESYELAPIKPETVSIDAINKQGLVYEYKQLFDKVDIQIAKGKDNFQIDDRIKNVNYNKYYNESYELFRLHLSEFINLKEHEIIKKKIIKIINDNAVQKKIKRNLVRAVLFKLIDKNLYSLFKETTEQPYEQEGGKYNRFVYILNKMPNLDKYEVINNREICNTNNDREKCGKNINCYWGYDECNFALTRDLIIIFVNKISEELANNDHKAFEILKKDDYFVSDIANYNKYEEREGQIILKSTNNTINKTLVDLFGRENIPKIGKRRILKTNIADLQEMNIQNPLHNMGEYFIQYIIDENITLFRAYANGYIWLKHVYYDIDSRNLGFYSNLQTDMANYFRSNVIDWIYDKNNYPKLIKDVKEYLETDKKNFIVEFINKISKDVSTNTNGIVEFYILNQIHSLPILVYDKYNTILYIIDNGIIFNKFNENEDINDKKFSKYRDHNNLKNYLNIRFTSLSMSQIPITIEVAFYK